MKLQEPNLMNIIQVCCDLRDDEWDQITKFGMVRDVDRLALMAFAMRGPKWCLTTDAGVAVLAGGLIPQRLGVMGSWCLISNTGWRDHAAEVTKTVEDVVSKALAGSVHRIETVCLASRERAQRWYETIGLKKESTLKGYCVDGSDAVMFTAVRAT